jgi:predicted MFS family arabinose efflux permease
MDRRVIWLCVAVGSTVGGLVPEAWGGSAFGVMSVALGLVGALAGLWLGARLAGY